MSDQTFFITRDVLHGVFDGNMRAVKQFETIQDRVADTSEAVTANVAATGRLENAAFVTLSANAELPNERVLALGPGLEIDTSEDGIVKLSAAVAATGGHQVQLSTAGPTVLALPTVGTLATRAQAETLENKTLDAPNLSGLGDYADDAAAATGGVPIGGVYRDGSDLRVRIA
jgi:hypothetical protein